MSPRKKRGGTKGRGRSIPKGRGTRQRQMPLTADNNDTEGASNDPEGASNDAEGASNEANASLKQSTSQSTSLPDQNRVDLNEERELSLPRLKSTVIAENSTLASVLNRGRNSDNIMSDDEMDHVQWELESMLTSLILHKNTVKDELNTFASMQFSRSQKKRNKNPRLPKITPRAAAEISPVNECRKIKIEFDPTSKELPPSKTESANRFWTQVEPFLAHVKKEDVIWLENLVKSYEPNDKLYEIPPLGEHYSKTWTKEELEMQKNQSSSSPRPNKKIKLTERITPDVVELVNRVNSALQDGNPATPVYQRVVSALKEHVPSEDTEEHLPECDDEDKPREMSNTCKEFYAEQNVKKQLNKLGLMGRYSKMVPPTTPFAEPSSSTKPDDEQDEILDEILKVDRELAQLREVNKNSLTKLLNKCHIDYRQQIVKNKIDIVNEKILNFKRMQNESWTNERKSSQVNTEDEELNFLLNERSDLLLQLKTVAVDPSSILNLSASDEEGSSDGGFDSSKVIKTEKPEPDVNIKEECPDDYQTTEDFNLNIKQEIIEENIVCEEAYGEDMNMECDKLIIKGEIDAEEVGEPIYETNYTENIYENINNEGDQIGPKIDETASVNSCRSDTLSPNYFDIANSSCLDNANSSYLDTAPSCLDTTTCLETVTSCLDTNTCLDTVPISGFNLASGLETDIGLNSSCLDTVYINELNNINVKEKENSDTDEPINKLSCIEEQPSTSSAYGQTSTQIESNDPIEIKEEPVDYDDFTEDNMMVGVGRELRPRKLNETVYFEQYIGSSGDESDFVLSD